MNLLLLLPEDARDGARFTVGGARADHLRSVLEVKVGQRLHVGQLNGALGTAEVEKVGAHEVQLVATFEDA
ncbi:MAG: 16S rRNA (uracil(1498)-N(3))-methyltransferase, partial [Myxococcota bacterium]